MQPIRSLLFSLLFYPGTLLFVITGILAGIISTPAMLRVVLGWAQFNHWLARNVLGITVEVDGVVPPGAYLIAVKHQSMFETIEMLRIARIPIIVLKRELADLPLFGRLTRRYAHRAGSVHAIDPDPSRIAALEADRPAPPAQLAGHGPEDADGRARLAERGQPIG